MSNSNSSNSSAARHSPRIETARFAPSPFQPRKLHWHVLVLTTATRDSGTTYDFVEWTGLATSARQLPDVIAHAERIVAALSK